MYHLYSMTPEIRNDTPYCEDKIFFNNAGAALMPRVVPEAIRAYLEKEAQFGGYHVAETLEGEISGFYREAANLINCHPRNIAFVHDATEAYARALSSIPFRPHDFIITTDDDYTSNQIQFISLQRRFDINIVRIRNLENGDLDIDHFQTLIKQHKPKLVAVTHVPNNSGLVQDIETVGEICRKHDLLYLVDACQSTGQIVVDVNAIHCDFLSTTGRKFLRGPRGTGFLYVSDKALDRGLHPLFIDGKGAEWTGEETFSMQDSALRFQTWEAPYALVMGLTEALRYANQIGIEQIETYNAGLMDHLRAQLAEVDGVKTFDRGSKRCNILTWTKAQRSLDQISQALDTNAVYYSTSTKGWGLIDFTKKGIEWAIRFSPHYYNTDDECDRVVEVIRSI